ncbi:MAG: sulfurtransferase TusA family protein [Methanomassiliicoccales archaeon]
MEFNGCSFPDELEYTEDLAAWLKKEKEFYRVGITSLLLWTTGKRLVFTLKEPCTIVEPGRNLFTVEGPRYFGAVRLPVRAKIMSVNPNLPHVFRSTSEVYNEGWLCTISISEDTSGLFLRSEKLAEKLRSEFRNRELQCFSVMSDEDMVEIGTECSSVFVKLREKMKTEDEGFTVHLVSDDPTAPIEVVRWSDETGIKILESRKVGDLFHFLLRK